MSSFSTLRTTLVGCLVISSIVAANAQFKGGNDDGTHVGQSSNQLLGRNIFVGGSDDGTSVGLATAQLVGRNIFLGGVDDGTSLGLATAQPVGRNIFVGGSDDGTSFGLATAQPVGRNIFVGGSDDGTGLGLATAQPVGRNISLGGGNDGWAMALKSGNSTPLPVTLTDFSGRWQQRDALLLWKTATELNASHFELERSMDGRTFSQIQRVAAAGRGATYQYADVNIKHLLPAGVATIYYRLRSVDLGGAATYSGLVALKAGSSETDGNSTLEYAVFPNPARDVVTITVTTLPAAGEAAIRLVDITGRILLLQKMTSNRQQLSVLAFVDGVYFLQLLAAGKVVYTQRLIISK